MEVTEFGIEAETICVPQNAPIPIVVTVSGMVTFTSDEF